MAGRVGNRLLVLKNAGDDGLPTMEIVTIQNVSKVGNKGQVRGKLTDIILFVPE